MNDLRSANEGGAQDGRRARPRRRRLWLWLAGFVFFLLGILILLALAAPSILSSGFGRSLILGAVNRRIPGAIRAGSISLAWFGGQSVKDLEVMDPQGERAVACREITTEATLWGLAVRGRYNLGATRLVGLEADVKVDRSGVTNLQQAVAGKKTQQLSNPSPKAKTGKSAAGEPPRVPASLAGDLELKGALIQIAVPGEKPVQISDLNGSVRIRALAEPVRFQFSGQTKQGDLSGALSGNGTVASLFNRDGTLSADRAEANLTVSADGLPVDGLDQLMGMGGRLRAALGPRLDLSAESLGSAQKTRITVSAKSENLTGDLAASLEGGRLSLRRPGSVTLEITPELARILSAGAKEEFALELKEKTLVQLTLDQFSMPIGARDLSAVAVQAGLSVGDLELSQVPSVGNVALRGFQAAMEAPSLSKEAHFALSGFIEQGGQKNRADIEAVLKNWLDERGRLRLETMEANVKANLADAPVALIDELTGLNGLLAEALGPRLNFSATATGTAERKQAQLTVQSERLTLEAPLTIGEAIALSGPAKARLKASPALVKRLAPGESAPRLRNEALVEATVSRLSVPLPKAGQSWASLKLQDIAMDAELSIGELQLAGLPQVGEAAVRDLKARVSGESLGAADLGASALVEPKKDDKLLNAAIGPSAKIELTAQGGPTAQKGMNLSKFELRVSSERANLTARGRLSDKLALTEPVSVDLVLTPALIEALALGGAGRPTLAGPTPVHLTIEPFEAALKGFAPDTLRLAAKASIPEMALAGDPRLKGASIRDAAMALEIDPKANAAKVHAEGEIAVPGQSQPARFLADGRLTGLLRGGKWAFEAAAMEATARLEGVPVAFVEALSGPTRRIEPLVGPQVNVEVTAGLSGGPTRTGTVDVKAQSERLTVNASAQLGEELALRAPAALRWTLTPEAFATLVAAQPEKAGQPAAPPALALASPTTVEATIQSLRLPLRKGGKGTSFDPSGASFDAVVSTARLALSEPARGRTTIFEQLQSSVRCAGPKQPMAFRLTGRVAPGAEGAGASGAPQGGVIDASGEISDLFAEGGKADTSGMSAKVQASLAEMPAAALDSALGAGGKIAALFGDLVGLKLDLDLKRRSGPIAVSLAGPSCRLSVDAALSPEGLTLRTPAQAEATVTPQLTQVFLKRINPLLVTAVGAENPITLNVPPEGFLVPTSAPVLPRARIARVNVDLGTIILENGGVLQALLGLLKVNVGQRTTARFAPVKARLQDGVATYEPTGALIAEQVRVVTWGQVDLVRDQVDMQLGITADTLEKAFNVKGLDPDTIVSVPMRGPTSKVKVDWSKASEQIAVLTARGQLQTKSPEASQLLEGLLGGTKRPPVPTPKPAPVEPTPAQPPAEQPQATPTPTPTPGANEIKVDDVLNLFLKKKK